MACAQRYHFQSHKPILYYDELNPQGRSCLMLFRVLQIDVELRSPQDGEQCPDTYREMHPAGVTPTLFECNLKLCDGHTIMMYLCDKYAAARLPHLFPCDYMARMEIQNMLFYEAGILYQLYFQMMTDIILEKYSNVNMDYYQRKVSECYNTLDRCLDGHTFLVGNGLTIADFSIITTVSSLDLMIPITKTQWPNLYRWFKMLQNMQCYQFNQQGINVQQHLLETVGEFPFPQDATERNKISSCSKQTGNYVPFPSPEQWQDNEKLQRKYQNSNKESSSRKTLGHSNKANCQTRSTRSTTIPTGQKCSKYENSTSFPPNEKCCSVSAADVQPDITPLYVKSFDNCFADSEAEELFNNSDENTYSNFERKNCAQTNRDIVEPTDDYGNDCDNTQRKPRPTNTQQTKTRNRSDKNKCVEFRQPDPCPCCMASMQQQTCLEDCKRDICDKCQLREFKSCLCLEIERSCQNLCPCAAEKEEKQEYLNENDDEEDICLDIELARSPSLPDQEYIENQCLSEENSENQCLSEENFINNDNEIESNDDNFNCDNQNVADDNQCDIDDKAQEEDSCEEIQAAGINEDDDENVEDNDDDGNSCASSDESNNNAECCDNNTSAITICLCDSQGGRSVTICYNNDFGNQEEISETGSCEEENSNIAIDNCCEKNSAKKHIDYKVSRGCQRYNKDMDYLPNCRCSRLKNTNNFKTQQRQSCKNEKYDGVALVCHCDMVDSSCFLCTCEDIPHNEPHNRVTNKNFPGEKYTCSSRRNGEGTYQCTAYKCDCCLEESEDSCTESSSSEMASEDNICQKPIFRPSVVCHNIQDIIDGESLEEAVAECNSTAKGKEIKEPQPKEKKEVKRPSKIETKMTTKSSPRLQKKENIIENKTITPEKMDATPQRKVVEKQSKANGGKTELSPQNQELRNPNRTTKPAQTLERTAKNISETKSKQSAEGSTKTPIKTGNVQEKTTKDAKIGKSSQPKMEENEHESECEGENQDLRNPNRTTKPTQILERTAKNMSQTKSKQSGEGSTKTPIKTGNVQEKTTKDAKIGKSSPPNKEVNEQETECEVEKLSQSNDILKAKGKSKCGKEQNEDVDERWGKESVQKCPTTKQQRSESLSKNENKLVQPLNTTKIRKDATTNRIAKQENKDIDCINRSVYIESKSCKRETQHVREIQFPRQRKPQESCGKAQCENIDPAFNAGSQCCAQKEVVHSYERPTSRSENENFCNRCPQNYERGCCGQKDFPRSVEEQVPNQDFCNKRQMNSVAAVVRGESPQQNVQRKHGNISNEKEAKRSSQKGQCKSVGNQIPSLKNVDLCNEGQVEPCEDKRTECSPQSISRKSTQILETKGSKNRCNPVENNDSVLETSNVCNKTQGTANTNEKSTKAAACSQKVRCKLDENQASALNDDNEVCNDTQGRQNVKKTSRRLSQTKGSKGCTQKDICNPGKNQARTFDNEDGQVSIKSNCYPRNVSHVSDETELPSTSLNAISCTVSCQVPKLVLDNFCLRCQKQMDTCRCNTKRSQTHKPFETKTRPKCILNAKPQYQESNANNETLDSPSGAKAISNTCQKQKTTQCQQSTAPSDSKAGGSKSRNITTQKQSNPLCNEAPTPSTPPVEATTTTGTKPKSNENATKQSNVKSKRLRAGSSEGKCLRRNNILSRSTMLSLANQQEKSSNESLGHRNNAEDSFLIDGGHTSSSINKNVSKIPRLKMLNK
ncbi:uncharacterized protein [Musca autumnalis]|uniref:uncharacterized protein n=1 Tax=Musca autumnalis TaxID=221902 RepID=UPI003CF5E9F4